MISEPKDDRLWSEPLGGLARSIVSCPESFELVVEGVPLAAPGILHGVGGTGVVRLLSKPNGDLARLANLAPPALMYVESALAGWRNHSLAIVGELDYVGEVHEEEDPEAAHVVIDLIPSRVVIMGPLNESLEAGRVEADVPLAEFRSGAHAMNSGYLQRAAEHANACHQSDQRRSVALSLGRPISDIGGVEIHHINSQSAYVDWLDTEGAIIEPVSEGTVSNTG